MFTILVSEEAHDTQNLLMEQLEGFRMEVEHTTHPGVTRKEDLFFVVRGADGAWIFRIPTEDGEMGATKVVVAQGDLVAVKVF